MSDAVELRTDRATRAVYATDNSIYQVEPQAVALPRSTGEVADLVRTNADSDSPRPIVARGAGTGTNGQSLTGGIAVDLKRHLHRIVTVDPAAQTATVEPGVVAGRLDAELAASGLFWAPHTSTRNRCTVGGMVATDAAGKGSLIHGRTHRHVLALDVVLDDGTPWRAAPLPVAEAEARAEADDRIGRLWRDLLDIPVTEGADLGLPELARGFSGYGLDRFRRDGLVDPVALLCGSEGTLAVITGATLRLTPLPAHTVLLVATYATFADALDDAVDLAVTKPAAIEAIDETTLEQGRASPAWPALAPIVGTEPGAVLLLEYTGGAQGDHADQTVHANHAGHADGPDLGPIIATLQRTGRSRATRAITDPAARAAAWKVRADAVGLLARVAVGRPERSARPMAFVEDCAVPVRSMPAFIGGFRRILDRHELTYAMFGHADVGCVHVRPALDLTDPAHETLVRTVTDEVVALVAQHGGVLWGEHGRGFRGDPVDAFLPPTTIELMRRVKTAFDPHDRLNPGKLYRPLGVDQPLVALDDVPTRGRANRVVPVGVRRVFDTAFACNGNALCHHLDAAEVMCPSYQATGDPALSPKGRADLLRAWLAARPGGANDSVLRHDELEEALAANLHQCLSCSACTGRCPVEVDIPELKSQFLAEYHRRRRRPTGHAVLSRFERLADLASRVPSPLARLGRPVAERALGLVDLPIPPVRRRVRASSLPPLPSFNPATPAELVLLPDAFTKLLDPDTLPVAVEVLTGLGWSVQVGPFIPSGKYDHVKGDRMAFKRAATAQAEAVEAVAAVGARPVVIEPAVALLHGHEYPLAVAGYPADDVAGLIDVIEPRIDRLRPSAQPRAVTLLGHCTERTTRPSWLAGWARLLTAAGHTVTAPALGCCGMAGLFGHERDNQAMSRALFELGWAEAVAGGDALVATGYSCRSQIARLAGRTAHHPVHLLT